MKLSSDGAGNLAYDVKHQLNKGSQKYTAF